MDLGGFGGFIEKFEEYFGRRATRWLLATMGAAIFAVCLGAVWQWLAAPIFAAFENHTWPKKLAGLFYFLGAAILGSLMFIAISLAFAGLRGRIMDAQAELEKEADEEASGT